MAVTLILRKDAKLVLNCALNVLLANLQVVFRVIPVSLMLRWTRQQALAHLSSVKQERRWSKVHARNAQTFVKFVHTASQHFLLHVLSAKSPMQLTTLILMEFAQ